MEHISATLARLTDRLRRLSSLRRIMRDYGEDGRVAVVYGFVSQARHYHTGLIAILPANPRAFLAWQDCFEAAGHRERWLEIVPPSEAAAVARQNVALVDLGSATFLYGEEG